MTTIVYKDDVLASDSYWVVLAGDSSSNFFAPKVHISEDKTFAYGSAGNECLDKKDVENFLSHHIFGTGRKEDDEKYAHYFFLIMTKDKTYCIETSYDEEYYTTVTLLHNHVAKALGTGGRVAMSEHLMGGSAIRMITAAKIHDTKTAGDIHAIKRSSLKKRKD